MDIRSIANNAANIVNPNIAVSFYRSIGFTVGAGRVQTPTYADPVALFAQMQRVNQFDQKKFEHLTTQGVLWKLSMRGQTAGVIRLTSQGGDKLVINGQTWYVLAIREQWQNWVSAIVVMQEGPQ